MKTAKTLADLRTKSADELEKLASKLREDLRAARLDIMTGKSKNGAAVAKIKRDIARVLTVRNEPRA